MTVVTGKKRKARGRSDEEMRNSTANEGRSASAILNTPPMMATKNSHEAQISVATQPDSDQINPPKYKPMYKLPNKEAIQWRDFSSLIDGHLAPYSSPH
jgi:hypothetical protein